MQPPFYPRNPCFVRGRAFCSAVEICFPLPTKPLPSRIGAPIASVKWLLRQPACSSAISGTRRRGEEVCSIMLVTCSESCEREGGRKRMSVCIQDIRTFLQILEGTETDSSGLAAPTLDVSAASRQNTKRLVVLSRPKHWKNCCTRRQ